MRLIGISGECLVQLPCSSRGWHSRLPGTLTSWVLSMSMGRGYKTKAGSAEKVSRKSIVGLRQKLIEKNCTRL